MGLDTERRMEQSCLSTAKQVDNVLLTWELIDMSESRWISRSRTAADGVTKSLPTRSGASGSWWSRRLVADQRISVFAAFSWRRLNASTQRHDRCTLRCVIVGDSIDKLQTGQSWVLWLIVKSAHINTLTYLVLVATVSIQLYWMFLPWESIHDWSDLTHLTHLILPLIRMSSWPASVGHH